MMNNEEEIWKDILGFDGYQISNRQRVRSLAHNTLCKNGSIKACKEKILSPCTTIHGYLFVNIGKSNMRKNKNIHNLVAMAFIPNPDNKPNINHINGVKTDNRVDNLEWCTQKENCQHAWDIGLSKGNTGRLGKLHHLSKEVHQFTLDGEYLKTYGSYSEAERETKSPINTIAHYIDKSPIKTAKYIWSSNRYQLRLIDFNRCCSYNLPRGLEQKKLFKLDKSSFKCERKGAIVENGSFFCKFHLPENVAKRNEKSKPFYIEKLRKQKEKYINKKLVNEEADNFLCKG